MYGYVWLCMAMHGYVGLFMAVYGYVSEWVSEWKLYLPTVILSNNFT